MEMSEKQLARRQAEFNFVKQHGNEYERLLAQASEQTEDGKEKLKAKAKLLLKATRLQPDAPEAYHNLGALYQPFRQDLAAQNFLKAIERIVHPEEHPESRRRWASAAAGAYTCIYQWICEGATIKELELPAWIPTWLCLAESKQAMVEKVVAWAPQSAQAWQMKGFVYGSGPPAEDEAVMRHNLFLRLRLRLPPTVAGHPVHCLTIGCSQT